MIVVKKFEIDICPRTLNSHVISVENWEKIDRKLGTIQAKQIY